MSKQSRKPKTSGKLSVLTDGFSTPQQAEGILSLLKAIQVDSRNKSCWEVIDILVIALSLLARLVCYTFPKIGHAPALMDPAQLAIIEEFLRR